MSSPIARLKFRLVALFNRIITKHYKWLLARAVRICGNRIQAEDLVQETLWHTLDRLEQLKSLEEPSVRAYLLAAMKNRFVDMCRRQKHELLGLSPYVVEPAQESPEEAMEAWRWVNDETFHEARRVLSDKEQRVLDHHLEGKSYEEIARVVGLKPGSIGRMLFDIRQKLGGRIKKRN